MDGGYYEVKINVNYPRGNLKVNEIFKVYYDLLKECTENVWSEIRNNFNSLISKENIISDSGSDNTSDISEDNISDISDKKISDSDESKDDISMEN